MEIRVLRYFLAVAREESITRAALTAGGADGGKAVHTGNAKDHAYK